MTTEGSVAVRALPVSAVPGWSLPRHGCPARPTYSDRVPGTHAVLNPPAPNLAHGLRSPREDLRRRQDHHAADAARPGYPGRWRRDDPGPRLPGPGPLAGGILAGAYSWPAIFLVNAPIGVVLLLVGLRALSESRNPSAPAIDIPGTILSVLGIGALTYGLVEGGSRGWTSPVIQGSFAAAVLILAVFAAVEW
jgi:hypothetical protein